jgi:hypothetical protein
MQSYLCNTKRGMKNILSKDVIKLFAAGFWPRRNANGIMVNNGNKICLVKQLFRWLPGRNILWCLIFGAVVCFYSSKKLSFTIAGKGFGFLENGHGTKAKINDPAKLCKKKNK